VNPFVSIRANLKPLPFLVLLLAACAIPLCAQQMQSQPKQPAQAKPIPIAHLYWHFLIWQNVLDNDAATRAAEGKNGDGLRDDLQHKLGFSDADYAPIRTSSQRLASELKPLNGQIKALESDSLDAAQLRRLEEQREADVNSEVYNLRQELSPQDVAAFEAFLVRFFAPKQITATITTSRPAAQGVQK
jgi:hypothetical protein